MKKLPQSLILALCSILFISCQDQKKPCSDEFLSAKSEMEKAFANVYLPTATSVDKETLVESIDSFLKDHSGVKCLVGKKTLDHTRELVTFLSTIKGSGISAKVIYGEDDRVDVEDSTNDLYKVLAASTAIQLSKSSLRASMTLPTRTLGSSMNLCEGEAFREQINPGRCSAFLVGEDILVTAGHCVKNQSQCDDFSYAFGFVKGVKELDPSQVYNCKKIISQKLESGAGLDYAVIQLDRKVTGRQPLKFRTEGSVKVGDPLVVIGHPSGLPTKIADGASVRSIKKSSHFIANLDTFGGNSGSAVFNAQTGIIEGILVRGETDYVDSKNPDGTRCRTVKKCKNNACRGEDVTRITKVPALPNSSTGVLGESSLFEALFSVESLALSKAGGAIEFRTYSFGNSTIAGRKFLGLCGAHTFTKPSEWLKYDVVNCDELNKLSPIYTNFVENN